MRSVYGEEVDWGVAEHLLSTLINDARHANSGKKILPESQKITPPGAEPAVKTKANGHKPAAGIDELNALFDGR